MTAIAWFASGALCAGLPLWSRLREVLAERDGATAELQGARSERTHYRVKCEAMADEVATLRFPDPVPPKLYAPSEN